VHYSVAFLVIALAAVGLSFAGFSSDRADVGWLLLAFAGAAFIAAAVLRGHKL
jgi:hypothetical protein